MAHKIYAKIKKEVAEEENVRNATAESRLGYGFIDSSTREYLSRVLDNYLRNYDLV